MIIQKLALTGQVTAKTLFQLKENRFLLAIKLYIFLYISLHTV